MVMTLNTDSPQEVKMNTMTIELPVEGLPSPAELPNNFSDEARYLLALKLFEQGRISSGKAGRLAGMGRVEFLLAASRDGVPVVDMTDEEMAEEFAA
jgi:predicted HTH domain antitoxin